MTAQSYDEDVRQIFYETYKDWVSRHLILNELFLLEPFVELIENDEVVCVGDSGVVYPPRYAEPFAHEQGVARHDAARRINHAGGLPTRLYSPAFGGR